MSLQGAEGGGDQGRLHRARALNVALDVGNSKPTLQNMMLQCCQDLGCRGASESLRALKGVEPGLGRHGLRAVAPAALRVPSARARGAMGEVLGSTGREHWDY